MALSGWFSFRNFGMPGIVIWVAFLCSNDTKSLQFERLGLTLRGSAPKFSKRTILAGPHVFCLGFGFLQLQVKDGVTHVGKRFDG